MKKVEFSNSPKTRLYSKFEIVSYQWHWIQETGRDNSTTLRVSNCHIAPSDVTTQISEFKDTTVHKDSEFSKEFFVFSENFFLQVKRRLGQNFGHTIHFRFWRHFSPIPPLGKLPITLLAGSDYFNNVGSVFLICYDQFWSDLVIFT